MSTDDGKVAFRIVSNAKTPLLPHGDVKLAMERLDDYYHPKTVATVQVLLRQFDNLRLADRQDPGKFITELEGLRLQISSIDSTKSIDDSRFIGHVLNSLPSEYDTAISMIEYKLDESPDTVTVGYIMSQLSLRYQRLYGFQIGSSSSTASTAVAVDQALYSGGFKGTCWSCGKVGHKSYQCPNKNAPSDHTTTIQANPNSTVVSNLTSGGVTTVVRC
jgi:hypothetical protein